MGEPRDDRSLGELFGALTTQLGQLIHKEVELARTEITANALRAGRNASLIGAGGVVIHAEIPGAGRHRDPGVGVGVRS